MKKLLAINAFTKIMLVMVFCSLGLALPAQSVKGKVWQLQNPETGTVQAISFSNESNAFIIVGFDLVAQKSDQDVTGTFKELPYALYLTINNEEVAFTITWYNAEEFILTFKGKYYRYAEFKSEKDKVSKKVGL